ncbi:TetR/AcrR family transcriptional regulator [Nocardia transvalensis]|uniref:TetR/AcrR family transcriptional regulator n=1 Tax=Nocardia transvalensis TaxID=37333 RepID=UPI0018938CCB|nr:TetR/AcrR family transcriptional regulator [Nocardia transvalensis]MBF6331089.1 TetR/AcrR family transcriptional regulator [Nocardia transvalensis]
MAGVTTPGRRERNKQEKLSRITAAARHLFREKGFPAVTTREIADVADIGEGTLFNYVQDKADLLVLVYGDMIESAVERAFKECAAMGTLFEQMEHAYRELLRLYAADLDNYRHLVKYTMFDASPTPYGERAIAIWDRAQLLTRELIEAAQRRGEIVQNVDATTLARNLYASFLLSLLQMLTPAPGCGPQSSSAETDLAAAFTLQLEPLTESSSDL